MAYWFSSQLLALLKAHPAKPLAGAEPGQKKRAINQGVGLPERNTSFKMSEKSDKGWMANDVSEGAGVSKTGVYLCNTVGKCQENPLESQLLEGEAF